MQKHVCFVKMKSDAKVPNKGSAKAAGYDLCAYLEQSEIVIEPHSTQKIGTGLMIAPPDGYCGMIFARSGIATKQGLRPANCVGVCDEDYTGEYMIALHNDTDYAQIVKHGDRIAQLVFLPYLDVKYIEVDALEATDRGCNGFGSTGK